MSAFWSQRHFHPQVTEEARQQYVEVILGRLCYKKTNNKKPTFNTQGPDIQKIIS